MAILSDWVSIFLSILFKFLKTHKTSPLMGIRAPTDLGIHLH